MLDKKYDFKQQEAQLYTAWEENGFFSPQKSKTGENFSIVLPPPNANADLHMGHAMYVVEDILVRFHRMLGDSVLWLPGSDHAGFETQFVFEKHLAKEGKSRFDFPREELYQKIWDFVQKNKSTMENQLRRLGFSADWSREKFTLDPSIVKIVLQTFKQMNEDGLIYRGERLVNYCTHCGTSFSDLEITHLAIDGKLWFIKYPIKDFPDQFITVATTRPETLLGDTAVAVNPKDERYAHLVGKMVILPITNREIPIIADDYVESSFGSGVVKITPAHDENDWNVGLRHNLARIQVIGFDGRIKNNPAAEIPADLIGLTNVEARKVIMSRLTEANLVEKEAKHPMVLSKCYKCNTTLEPLPLPQWFIKVKSLTEKAIQVVKDGEIKIVPSRFEKTYYQWLENLHDWNISRQVVWGIRIPAWNCKKCEKWTITDGEVPTQCSHCKGTELLQDSDSFDTWFSSSQWPFATLQTTQKGDFESFYPTNVLDTMWDILPFWVIRMVMLGLYKTGKVPFRNVYLHSRVTDSKGQKMSKSKGNVVNPLDMVDKFGADALRISLVVGAAPGNDVAFSEPKIIGYRNFANKIWNIARFVLLKSPEDKSQLVLDKNILDKILPEDKDILEKLNGVIESVTKNLHEFHFSLAGEEIYQFIWHEFADVYIEKSKERLMSGDVVVLSVLYTVLVNSLKLVHPFMPFVTEAIWQNLQDKNEPWLINASWPKKIEL